MLLLALALPAFNFITGGRSIDGAQNQISAFLGRSRAEAIGLQETRGVMFFVDPATPDRVSCALVRQTAQRPGDDPNVSTYLDLVPDSDFLQLPRGVGLQLVDNVYTAPPAAAAVANRDRDQYIGYNSENSVGGGKSTNVQYGGVILFDGAGRLVNGTYAFRVRAPNPNPGGGPDVYTAMAEMLFRNSGDKVKAGDNVGSGYLDVIPVAINGGANSPPLYMQSQFGLVLYDLPTFQSKGFSRGDPQIDPGMSWSAELGEEQWITDNSTAVLINRYNGTIVKG